MPDQPKHASDHRGNWALTLLEDFRHNDILIADSIVDKLEFLLNGPITDQELSAGALKDIAAQLIKDIAYNPGDQRRHDET